MAKPADDKRDAALFREFVTWMTRSPAFGAHSKREIELKVVELLYAHRLDVTVGDVAAELAVTRSRARNLLLEARVRQGAGPRPAAARGALRCRRRHGARPGGCWVPSCARGRGVEGSISKASACASSSTIRTCARC